MTVCDVVLMDEEEHEQGIASGGGALLGRHLSKRSRKDKGLVVVFDANARKEFVTGFHKRKKKRRKIAEQQKQLRDRQKRLQERRERRLALKESVAQSEPQDTAEGDYEELVSDQDVCKAGKENGTVMYEDDDMTTVVNTYSIDMSTDLQARSYPADHGKAIESSTTRKPDQTAIAARTRPQLKKSVGRRLKHCVGTKRKHGSKQKKRTS